MSYELVGTVKVVMEMQTFASGFTKREFVVTTEDDYPQEIKFECIKERCALLDHVQVGGRVKVQFRVRGNEYKERYYVNLQAYQLEKLDVDGSSVSMEPDAVPMDEPDLDIEDGMPF